MFIFHSNFFANEYQWRGAVSGGPLYFLRRLQDSDKPIDSHNHGSRVVVGKKPLSSLTCVGVPCQGGPQGSAQPPPPMPFQNFLHISLENDHNCFLTFTSILYISH